MKETVIGIIAHVDAGKTTLSESLLYHSGTIRKAGRVDHGDTFLDFDEQEKNRGITIFSKEAVLSYKDKIFTLVDTPGHMDFSGEVEKVLNILDVGIIVVNAMNGIDHHSEKMFNMLRRHHIPVFIFVNKMDIPYVNKEKIFKDIQLKFDEKCIDFTMDKEMLNESIAMTSDALLEDYMKGNLPLSKIQDAVMNRKLFPVYFGSALKMQGIEAFFEGLYTYTSLKKYPSEFGAKVYRISRDDAGNRLTHMKITGGSLKAKTKLSDNEKVDQIRKYNGTKYELINEVEAGSICAVKGLVNVQIGEGLGSESSFIPGSEAVLNYRMILPDGMDSTLMMKKLRELFEERPQLHIEYLPNKEIHVSFMGELQMEVFIQNVKKRFDIDVSFDEGNVVYKETILESVEGVGHFEPLRHYSEVHVFMEPGELHSGLIFSNACGDEIPKKYQNQIMNYLEDIQHVGVLTGSTLTDIRLTLVGAKAHEKHSEGGDFLQATKRAIRQGLKSTSCIVMEPYYLYQMEIPASVLSRVIYDLENMNATFTVEENGENQKISGKAPVVKIKNYMKNLNQYTRGKGVLSFEFDGYYPCSNSDEIVEKIGYDSESDLENPTGSIFCKQGAAYYVPWNEVKNHMHIKSIMQKTIERQSSADYRFSEKEVLVSLFPKNQGTKRKQMATGKKKVDFTESTSTVKVLEKCILVDGYNVIYSWEELKSIASENIAVARDHLIEKMCNYQGYKKCPLILVFDAYKVKENVGTVQKYDNIYVVYTKTAQTADMYIESATKKHACEYNITVVTSDAMIQLITIGKGASRMSSKELEKEYEYLQKTVLNEVKKRTKSMRNHSLESIRILSSDEKDGKETL